MRVFLDPWDVEYTSFFQVEEETLGAKVKLDIELPEEKWAPISVEGAFSQKEIVFIDGIRKMHQRVVVEGDGGIFFGGFGTYVAGAIKLNIGKENRISNSLVGLSIKRVLVLPEEIVKNVRSSYQVPKIPFPFELRSSSENDPLSPLKKLQELMRLEERKVADEVLNKYGNIFIVVDGTLYFPWKNAKILGFIKSLHNLYLPENLIPVILKLREGQRTPVFSISFKDREVSKKYSWFVRLKNISEGEFPYAGIVRLEAPGEISKDDLKSLTIWSTSLSQFVSDRMRDKRSPQNLLPVGHLERELKRRVGDEYLIDRTLRSLVYGGIFFKKFLE